MNPRSTLIVSIIFLSVLLHVCPSQCCPKKIRALIRNRGKEEKPAELARDEASFIKYSHSSNNNFYIEIIQNENKTFVVREMDYPPVSMNQVAGEDLHRTTMEPSSKEPDAEYIETNTTRSLDTNETMPVASSTEAGPPLRNETAEGAVGAEGDEEEEEILAPEDANVRREWGGKCVVKDWERCNKIRQIVVIDVINNQFQRKNLDLDCLLQPILCLRNGWTCNRCHILCMAAQCNKQLFYDWDGTVDFEGPCRYRK